MKYATNLHRLEFIFLEKSFKSVQSVAKKSINIK